jgi:hypothetical protein
MVTTQKLSPSLTRYQSNGVAHSHLHSSHSSSLPYQHTNHHSISPHVHTRLLEEGKHSNSTSHNESNSIQSDHDTSGEYMQNDIDSNHGTHMNDVNDPSKQHDSDSGSGSHHTLSASSRWSFAVGHVLNDLTAAFWFSYLLVFLRSVLGFRDYNSGLLMLIGQVADAIATPISGYLSDKTTRQRAEYKSLLDNHNADKKQLQATRKGAARKVWIAIGSLVLALTFPPVFHTPFFIDITPHKKNFLCVLYYSFFIITLQFAWVGTC